MARGRIGRALAGLFELQDPAHARLLPMEGLRGAAVTLVFLQHAGMQALLMGVAPGWPRAAAEAMRHLGNLGVELFFVLSGYLIYGTLLRRRPRFSAFMMRRAQRLYPTFLAVFAMAFGLQCLTREIPPDLLLRPFYVIENLLFLPGLFPVRPVVTVAWSLSYEAFFYVATAVLVLGGRLWIAPRAWRLFAVLTMAALFFAGAFAFWPLYPVRMLPFFAGILLAEGAGARVPDGAAILAPVAAICAVGAVTMPEPLAELIVSAGFFALCTVCFRGTGVVSRIMAWRGLRWLGNMSYSYYLLHGYVVRAGSLAIGRLVHGHEPGWVFWLSLPVLYGATLIGSAALFALIEKPVSLRVPGRPAALGEKIPLLQT